MRYIVLLLVLLSTIIANAVTGGPQAQSMNPDYRAAYERWCSAIDSNPALGEAFWLRADTGPAQLKKAIRQLLSFGPNLTPFVVEQMRSEKDRLRLWRLVRLLDQVSGINLYFDSGEQNFYEAAPRFRDRFVEDWGSGKYLNADEVLGRVRMYQDQDSAQKVDPRRLTEIRRYGVFALPFIIKNLKQHNSSELFAAFLAVTGQFDLYADYIQNPSRFFPERNQKLSVVKAWANQNESKLDKLTGLHERVKLLSAR